MLCVPGVDAELVTVLSTAEVLMADCWLVLYLVTIEVPVMLPPLCTRWMAASNLAFTGLPLVPLMVCMAP